jgi:hypothetical protein
MCATYTRFMPEFGSSPDPRRIDLSPEAVEALEEQRRRFVEKFGREPGPHDPVFFNPDADEPEPLSDEQMRDAAALMEEFGINEEYRQRREVDLEGEGKIHRPGRNEPCPCGSGKKYKHCHGA